MPADASLRFAPVDAAICKKRNEQGSGRGEVTHLPESRRNFYNGGDVDDRADDNCERELSIP